MKYKATVIYEQTVSGISAWIEGYTYRPSDNGQWDNGFVPTHPEYGEEWAFKEACRRAKECACAILDGEDSEVNFEVVVEREDVEKENLDQDEYEFIDPSNAKLMHGKTTNDD